MRIIVFSHFTDKLKENKELRPPSTYMIDSAINLAASMLDLNTDGGIIMHDDDWMFDASREETRPRLDYCQNLKKVARKYRMTLVQPEKRLGYRGAMLKMASLLSVGATVDMRYFWLEHDWWMTTPIDLRLVEKQLDRPDCNYIKLPNYHDETERFKADPHPCAHFQKDVDRRQAEPGNFMRDSLWSTNPHFGKVTKFLEWADMVRLNPLPPDDLKKNGGAAGIEEVLTNKYLSDIDAMGFDAAHKKWGVWLMLNHGTFSRMSEHKGI